MLTRWELSGAVVVVHQLLASDPAGDALGNHSANQSGVFRQLGGLENEGGVRGRVLGLEHLDLLIVAGVCHHDGHFLQRFQLVPRSLQLLRRALR